MKASMHLHGGMSWQQTSTIACGKWKKHIVCKAFSFSSQCFSLQLRAQGNCLSIPFDKRCLQTSGGQCRAGVRDPQHQKAWALDDLQKLSQIEERWASTQIRDTGKASSKVVTNQKVAGECGQRFLSRCFSTDPLFYGKNAYDLWGH